MAYKFQLGSATLSGSLVREGNLTVSGATMQGQAAMNLDVQGLIKHDGTTVLNADRDLVNLVDIDGTGDLTMGTIGMTGFSVDADGDTALKSLAIDNSSTIGCDADTDIITLADMSMTLANNVDFNVAKAGGLQIGGVAVTSTAAELNLVDGITAGTVAASKAVIVDSNKDASGFRNVTTSGRVIVDDATEATSTTDGSLQTDGGLSVAKSAVIGDDLDLLSDAAVLNFGADKDVSLTHVADTGLLLNSSRRLQFGDSGTYISQEADGNLEMTADAAVNLSAPAVEFPTDGTILKFGDDSEVLLTHVHDTGLLLNSSMQLQFRDSTEYINSDANGYMHMEGATGVHLAVNGSNVAEATSAGLNVVGTLAADTSFTLDAVTVNATELGFVDGVTAGTAIASKAVVLDASKDVTGINNLTASYFKGNGSGITDIDVSNLDAAGSDKYVQFNQNGEFAGVVNLQFDGSGSLTMSGSSAGNQQSSLLFGASGARIRRKNDAYGMVLQIHASDGGIDLSGSSQGGVSLYGGDAANAGVSINGANGLNGMNAAQDGVNWNISQGGLFSGSSDFKANGYFVHGTEVISPSRELSNIASLDATTEGVIEAAIDTLANLTSVGTGGAQLDAAGTIDIAQNLLVTGSAFMAAVSGSGNFMVGGSLSAANLGNATVALTTDLMIIDDGANGTIKTTSLAAYATALANGSNEGLSSTAGRLGLDLNDLAGATVSVANDSIALIDADDSNATKKESIADLVSAMAGAGLTATNGVLSSDASPTPTDHGDASVTLVEGLNYTDTAFTAARSWTLPASPDAGDVIRVKAPTNAATYNLTIVKNTDQTIDGVSQDLILESNNAAVSLVYAADDYWVII